MIEKVKGTIVRMRKDLSTMEDVRLNRKGTKRNIPKITFLKKRYDMKYHDRSPKGYVWHHTYYDYDDPEAGLVLLSSKSHSMGHGVLRKLGYKIPRINFPK